MSEDMDRLTVVSIAGTYLTHGVFDATTTLLLIRRHGLGVEANPVMRWVLHADPIVFILVQLFGATVITSVLLYGESVFDAFDRVRRACAVGLCTSGILLAVNNAAVLL